MLTDKQILKQFTDRRNAFADWRDNNGWLRYEVKENYAIVEGDTRNHKSGHWLEGELDKRKGEELPSYTINKTQPVVDAICGFQIQNRTEGEYKPRSVDYPDKAQVDKVNDGLQYINDDSGAEYEESWAYRDMLTCGVGSTDTEISYDENYYGEPEVERNAPYLIGWDTSARKKNLVDRMWCFHGSLKDRESYLEEVNMELQENGKKKISSFGSSDDRFLEYFKLGAKVNEDYVIPYIYQWREKTPYWLVENPLLGNPILRHTDPQEQANIDSALKAMGATFDFNPLEDEIFVVQQEDLDKLDKALEAFHVTEYKKTKHSTWKYYRAKIVGDIVVSKSENISQKLFTQQFMTGKWSESRQCFVGIVTAAKDPQRLLNKGVSDLAEYAYTSPVSGVMIESDAVDDLQAFKETYSKARKVTIFRPNALINGKVKEKATTSAPQGRYEMIQFAEGSILQAMGVTMDFMGMGLGGSNDYDMMGKRIKQTLSTLAPWTDAMKQFTLDNTRLRIDVLRTLAENSRGLIIRNLSKIADPDGNISDYQKLLKDDIAHEYDIIAKEVAKSPDEQKELLDSLIRIAELVQQSGGDARGMLPLIIEQTDIPADKADEVLQATAPPPPPQPDPINQALLQSQSNLNNADAEYKAAQAKEKNLELLGKYQSLNNNVATKQDLADLAKTIAETQQIQSNTQNAKIQTAQSILNGGQP